MRALSSAELLDLWEAMIGRRPEAAALLLLSAVLPELPPAAAAALPIGRRDASLLELRERTFGSRLLAVAVCASCGERAEIEFLADDIRTPAAETGSELSVRQGETEILFRPPTTGDLLALEPAEAADVDSVREALARACILEIRDGSTSEADTLSPAVLEAVEAAMAESDPQADVRLVVTCPSCGELRHVPFDIVSFLLDEIDTWARRTLHEVATLASAFGWREPDVLALGPRRRQYYLASIGQ